MTALIKKDFKSYFFSPLGYFFCALFALVMNLFFFIDNLSSGINNIKPLFYDMILVMSLMVPILTMRSFSEEYKLKTDQLLLTAPISTLSVVMGKFFAVLSVCMCAIAFTLPYAGIVAVLSKLPVGEIAACYFGLVLAVSACVSIGLFFSCITENQIIAASGSFAIFLVLPFMDYLYNLHNPIINGLADVLNFYMRFSSYFVSGTVRLVDVIYYLSIIAIFLFLCMRVLEKKRYN